MTTLSAYALNFRGRLFPPLISGGMGTNISTDRLALAIEKIGGIAHASRRARQSAFRPCVRIR